MLGVKSRVIRHLPEDLLPVSQGDNEEGLRKGPRQGPSLAWLTSRRRAGRAKQASGVRVGGRVARVRSCVHPHHRDIYGHVSPETNRQVADAMSKA